MNILVILGAVMMLIGVAQALDAARRHAEGYEYARALFNAEFGLVFVAPAGIPSESLRLIVTIALGLSLVVTGVASHRLTRDFERRQQAAASQGSG